MFRNDKVGDECIYVVLVYSFSGDIISDFLLTFGTVSYILSALFNKIYVRENEYAWE